MVKVIKSRIATKRVVGFVRAEECYNALMLQRGKEFFGFTF